MKTNQSAYRAVASAFLLSFTIFSVPAFAAEPIQEAGTVVPVVDATSATSTQTTTNQTDKNTEFLSANSTLTETTPPVVDVVSVLENTVAEGRANLDDFMALLASKGITNISREEIESLKPTGTGSFSGTHLVSQLNGRVAVAVSGEVNHYTCTIVSGQQSCIPTSKVSYSKVLYKPSSDAQGVTVDTTRTQLTGFQMAFSGDGQLVTQDRLGEIRIYNTQGEIVAYARQAQIVSSATVPEGWTRAASNPQYAIRIDYNGPYQYAKVLNLVTGKETLVGTATAHRATVGVADVSPDGKVAIVVYNGLTSAVYIVKIEDTSKYRRVEGVYQSHQFQNRRVIVSVEVYDTATADPNDTQIQTVTIKLKKLLNSKSKVAKSGK